MNAEADAHFNRLARLAARAFSASCAVIVSWDGERSVIRGQYGLPLAAADPPVFVLDGPVDPQTLENALVAWMPDVRFYAGTPLETEDGVGRGFLAVFDREPHREPPGDVTGLLGDLAGEVLRVIEFERQKQDLEEMNERLVLQSIHLETSQKDSDRWQRRALHALEAGNMGYWERDAETDLITFSPVLEAMLGIAPGQFDGSVQAWLKHVHPDDQEAILTNIQRARDTGRNYLMKYRPLTKDGSERWITTTGTYRKDAAGRFAGAHGVSWDSTAIDLAAHQLKLSEELFRALSNCAPIGIFRSDLEKRLVYANPAMAAFNGVPEQELLGYGWMRFVHPDDRPQLMQSIQTATEQERSGEFEHRLLLPDGTVRWMHVRSVPIRGRDGKFSAKVGMVDDVTDQRLMVEDLRTAKETAEIANRAKDIFLANVSHELRTPLNGVLGMSDLLVDAGLTPDQLEMAQIVRESARGLLAVVNDMLDLSRIESGRLAIDCKPFDLRATIAQTISLFHAEAHGRNLALFVEYAPGLLDQYQGDAGRIRQIVTNYLSNALKFTAKGKVLVRVEGGSVNEEAAEISILVQDSGIGIAASDQQTLFRPFSQVDSSSTRRNQGAGLGLAICKRLAELMHGSVGVESRLGNGSTFWVKLRLLRPAGISSPVPCTARTALTGAGLRALVVEDNPVNQRVAVGVLKKLGWQVDMAVNGAAALQLSQRHQYAMILMDCQMPEMDGYAATRLIREWEKANGKRRVPIVALTAHVMPGDKERCLEAGMNDHLAKPIGLEELRATLDRWVHPSPEARSFAKG